MKSLNFFRSWASNLFHFRPDIVNLRFDFINHFYMLICVGGVSTLYLLHSHFLLSNELWKVIGKTQYIFCTISSRIILYSLFPNVSHVFETIFRWTVCLRKTYFWFGERHWRYISPYQNQVRRQTFHLQIISKTWQTFGNTLYILQVKLPFKPDFMVAVNCSILSCLFSSDLLSSVSIDSNKVVNLLAAFSVHT